MSPIRALAAKTRHPDRQPLRDLLIHDVRMKMRVELLLLSPFVLLGIRIEGGLIGVTGRRGSKMPTPPTLLEAALVADRD